MTTDTASLRALLDAATPGSWRVESVDSDKHPRADVLCEIEPGMDYCVIQAALTVNARLIVAAVNALPALLDDLDRYRAIYRQAAEWITDVQIDFGLGPEASPEDVLLVARTNVADTDAALTALRAENGRLRDAAMLVVDWFDDPEPHTRAKAFGTLKERATALRAALADPAQQEPRA